MTSGDKIRYFFENGMFDEKGIVQYIYKLCDYNNCCGHVDTVAYTVFFLFKKLRI